MMLVLPDRFLMSFSEFSIIVYFYTAFECQQIHTFLSVPFSSPAPHSLSGSSHHGTHLFRIFSERSLPYPPLYGPPVQYPSQPPPPQPPPSPSVREPTVSSNLSTLTTSHSVSLLEIKRLLALFDLDFLDVDAALSRQLEALSLPPPSSSILPALATGRSGTETQGDSARALTTHGSVGPDMATSIPSPSVRPPPTVANPEDPAQVRLNRCQFEALLVAVLSSFYPAPTVAPPIPFTPAPSAPPTPPDAIPLSIQPATPAPPNCPSPPPGNSPIRPLAVERAHGRAFATSRPDPRHPTNVARCCDNIAENL
ncbi:hypothetical protein PAPYR_769 [Paratrimastix pyriformis]|uniref:Uncharacterized protein n=1 Tax=Paratrimastix pyriformis TaxID=342808 RepID=A0ABQ8UYA0_9EUKA|nr:hypothetical protein PAPYR_769 [Paratrimastix pyriformis]